MSDLWWGVALGLILSGLVIWVSYPRAKQEPGEGATPCQLQDPESWRAVARALRVPPEQQEAFIDDWQRQVVPEEMWHNLATVPVLVAIDVAYRHGGFNAPEA